MKSLFKFILFISITLFLFSCNEDDATPIDTNAQEQDLIGTWNLTEESQDGKVISEQGIEVGTITSVGKDMDAQIVFTANPNNFTGSGGYTDVVNVSVLGQSIAEEEVVVSINDLINQGSWSIDQGILTLTANSVDQTANITELTTTTLKVEFDIEETSTLQGFTGTIDSTIKMTFTKQ